MRDNYLVPNFKFFSYLCDKIIAMTFAETEKTELKQKLTDTLVKEIVAFLNTDGGTIYIGVDDSGKVCGIDKLDESLKKTADIIESQILPDARDFVELGTKYIDYKHIIEIKVNKGDSLYYIKKYGRSAQGCYVRMGSTCRSMTEQQIEITHNKYLDSKVRITEITGAIKKPTFQYLKLLLTEKGLTINDKTFAENFHLLTQTGKYNKMSDLLADHNDISIKVVLFRGKNKADGIYLRNEYGGKCLVVAMKQVFDYCADVINETRTSFSRGMRIDMPLFDRDAFREVWFNACLHNNWADGTPPAVYIYTDRLEVISTGGLPANLSKDDFFRGVSKPVNEELAKLFIRLDLMEQTGYGIPRVTQHYGKNIFEFLDFFLRVTIPFEYELETGKDELDNYYCEAKEPVVDMIASKRKPTPFFIGSNEPIFDPTNTNIRSIKTQNDPINANIGSNGSANGDKTQDKLIDLIKENPNANYDEYASMLNISPTTIKRKLGKLKALGIIVRIGSNKTGHWDIIGPTK